MVRIFAGALALVLLIYGCHKPAHAAGTAKGYNVVTGKCLCWTGGLAAAIKSKWHPSCNKVCNSPEVRPDLRRATPAPASALDEVTDVSASRRHARGGRAHRSAGLRAARHLSDAGRARSGHRSPQRMDLARAFQTDRNGRGYASAPARLRAPIREVTHRRAHGLARTAIRAAAAGGQVAVEHSRPRDCYGIAWCGCWLRHAFGIPDRSLNLAINWARVGSPASPESANVVVWRHHVGKLIAHEGNRILVQSGNDGGAVRTRWLSPRVLGGVVAYRRV